MTYFNGFKQEFWQLFETLKDNNNLEWFAENKPCHEGDIITPCLNFMVDMGELLKEISHHYTAIP